MYYLIPLSIIALCLGALGYLVIRKFPQLSNLDVDNLPMEKEFRKKQEILDKRIEEQEKRLRQKLAGYMKPLRRGWGLFQLQFRIYVGKIERLWHHEERLRKIEDPEPEPVAEDQQQKLASILSSAAGRLKSGDFSEAEALFISAIKLDQKSVEAYRGLADTYLAQDSLEEAKQTYQFLLHMVPGDDNVMVKLADIAERQQNIEEAVSYYQQAVVANDSLSPRFYHLAELLLKLGQPEVAREAIIQAVELEPKNPKYLDLLIETVILCGDKDLAKEAYNELRMVNPDNQKLAVFREKINNL